VPGFFAGRWRKSIARDSAYLVLDPALSHRTDVDFGCDRCVAASARSFGIRDRQRASWCSTRAVVAGQPGGNGGAEKGDGPGVLAKLLEARGRTDAMDRRLVLLAIGIQQAGHLFLATGRTRQFGVGFVLAPVIGQRLSMGQQPRCLVQHLFGHRERRLAFRTTHVPVPPGHDKTSE